MKSTTMFFLFFQGRKKAPEPPERPPPPKIDLMDVNFVEDQPIYAKINKEQSSIRPAR